MDLRRALLPTVLLMVTAACADAQGYQYNAPVGAPPQGYQDAPQGYQGDPQGYQDAPQGYQGDPQGYQAPPQNYQPAQQQIVSITQFTAPLAPYGRWMHTQWGRAWVPNVPPDWRPYTVGQWVNDPAYGWTWTSDEPWGWATYHYGRWGFDPRIGWVWVPGLEWAPAWVAWRNGDDVTGWAPLPPQVSYSFAIGVGAAFNSWGYDQWYAPAWVYAPRATFYYPYQRRTTLPWQNGRNYWQHSRSVTHYDRDGAHVVNRSMDNVGPRPVVPIRPGHPDTAGYNGSHNGYVGDHNGYAGQNGQQHWNGQQNTNDHRQQPYGQPQYNQQGQPYAGQQRPIDTGHAQKNDQQNGQQNGQQHYGQQQNDHPGNAGQPAAVTDQQQHAQQHGQHWDRGQGASNALVPNAAAPAVSDASHGYGNNGGNNTGYNQGNHHGAVPAVAPASPTMQTSPTAYGGHGGRGEGTHNVVPVGVAPVPASVPAAQTSAHPVPAPAQTNTHPTAKANTHDEPRTQPQ
jgi:hypothetical protein